MSWQGWSRPASRRGCRDGAEERSGAGNRCSAKGATDGGYARLTRLKRNCRSGCDLSKQHSVFQRSMPSDLVRGWIPVRVKETRQNKKGSCRSFMRMLQSSSSIETRDSWVVASVALFIMMMAFGAAWITAVGLKDIAAEAGGARSIPAIASSLAWLGSGIGGILMGRIAERVGTRWTVICGALMIGLGLSISTFGPPWPLWIGHGLFIGVIGLGGINAPLYIYVSRWFDRRRGSALALISSGNYLAGALWPPVFERAIAYVGWRETMLWYGLLECLVIVPLVTVFFTHPPETIQPLPAMKAGGGQKRILGWPPNLVFGLLCGASILCCVPMAMPQTHLVAFCSDLGISRALSAAMLSLLLGTAFLSRQIWGAISDRIGGVMTVLIGSAWQCSALTAFLFTQDATGLLTVTAI